MRLTARSFAVPKILAKALLNKMESLMAEGARKAGEGRGEPQGFVRDGQ
jgi:hypothetical protein